MKVYLIKASTLSGSNFLETAYLDKATCELTCKEKNQEWIDHKSFETEGEKISNNRIIVDKKVYHLNQIEYFSALAKQIIKKLKPEEVDALKQYFTTK